MTTMTEYYKTEVIGKSLADLADKTHLALRIKEVDKRDIVTYEIGLADNKEFLCIFGEVRQANDGSIVHIEIPKMKFDLRNFLDMYYY